MSKNRYKKIALVLSLCLIVIWLFLGAGTSLAWFSDTAPVLDNVFHFADFDIEASFRLPDGTYAPIDGRSDIFNTEDMYEPGHTQVVHLKIENKGTVPVLFQTAIKVNNYVPAVNQDGETFRLQDHLLFGLFSSENAAQTEAAVADRTRAAQLADTKLGDYSTDAVELKAGGTVYTALVVRMHESVGNEANYRLGSDVPEVELGLVVSATQTR